MTEMRAALFDHFGSPEVLYEGTVTVPRIGSDQLLVRVRAVTVNGGDLTLRSGRLPRWFMRGQFPRQTGLDFVGEVVEVGSAVGGYAVGDRVWGLLDDQPDENGQTLRSLAEFVGIPATHVSLAPANLSPTEAVTVLGGTLALIALRRKAGLRPGESLLVRGASGGVGSLVVQLGASLGAHVTGLSRAANTDFVIGLGADEAYDYHSVRAEQLGPFDVVLDMVGSEMWGYRRRLAPGGRMVALGFDADHMVRNFVSIGASAVYGAGRIRFFRGGPEHDLLVEVARMVDDGILLPVVDEVYPLAQVAQAHRRLEEGGVRGKVVITVD